MDKFVKDAREDAQEKQADDVFQAWKKFSDMAYMAAHRVAELMVGPEKMNALCEAAIRAGQAETLAAYEYQLMKIAFHVGYKARREEEAR